MIEFNIVGAGRLGFAIANALHYNHAATLKGVYNQHAINSANVVKTLGVGKAIADLADLPPVDITFITTPDYCIQTVAEKLAEGRSIKPTSVIVHCSGVLDAQTALGSLKKHQCLIASIHPLKAFSVSIVDPFYFRDCPCAIEGDSAAIDLLTHLFNRLDAQLIPLNPKHKALYHAGATIAANYMVTLAATSSQCLQQAGISKSQTIEIVTQLMQSSLDNIKLKANFSTALTGPLARGDIETIQRHLEVLDDPLLHKLYQITGLATLPLTTIDEKMRAALAQLLGED